MMISIFLLLYFFIILLLNIDSLECNNFLPQQYYSMNAEAFKQLTARTI